MFFSSKFLFMFNIIILVKYIKASTDENKINYLEFPFKRNLSINDTSNPNIVIKNLFYNQIYINISIGSLKREIPFYIYLQQYANVVQSGNVIDSQVKGLFNESLSETYKIIKQCDSFVNGDMNKGILSLDKFFINNIFSNFTFYLSKQNRLFSHITEGGKIGFKLFKSYDESLDTCFIKNLKKNNLISSSIFLLKYDSNKNSGKLIIGAFPHSYDKLHYKEEYFISDHIEKDYVPMYWVFKFDEIKINDEIIEKNNKEIYFYYELGFIIGSYGFFQKLKNKDSFKYYFENNTKCFKTKLTINDLETNEYKQNIKGDYFVYYCDKDTDVKKLNISTISFVKKSMNYIFYFDENDLWIEKGNYKYFIILERNVYNSGWCFGKPFFEKYSMIFDYDNSQIGLYTKILNDKSDDKNDLGKNNIILYILVIIGLLIIIGFLVFWLIKCYINLPRKKRANELIDENFEYEEAKLSI